MMTVKELKSELQYSDDDEPILFMLDNESGSAQAYLEYVRAFSAAGGRMTVLSFRPTKDNPLTEIDRLNEAKDAAVRAGDYHRAAELRSEIQRLRS
jgi:hypothetical protein